MKPKKAMVERIATITPIATRNTPFTISDDAPKDAEHPEGGAHHQAAYRQPDVLRHLSEICRCRHIFAVLIFLFLMRIQELRELSFKLSYLPLVYPTFFMRLSVASVVFVSGA